MTQSRYFNAFLLSTLTFLLLYFIFLSFSKIEKVLKATPSSVIKIALITPPKKIITPKVIPQPVIPQVIIPPVIVKKIKKKEPKKKIVIVKPKPKPKAKKKIIKKTKKVIKKKVIRKKVIQKKIVKKRIIEKPVETYIPIASPIYTKPQPIRKPILKPSSPAPVQVKNNHHKKAFLRNVRSKIIANKKYPKMAKRRHIEGSVKVRFDITKQGQVSNIRFINGKRIFQKSIKKTLTRTFPMGIPANVKNELPIFDISVILHFNIK